MVLTWWQSRTTDRGGDAVGETLGGEEMTGKTKGDEAVLNKTVISTPYCAMQVKQQQACLYPAEPECV